MGGYRELADGYAHEHNNAQRCATPRSLGVREGGLCTPCCVINTVMRMLCIMAQKGLKGGFGGFWELPSFVFYARQMTKKG